MTLCAKTLWWSLYKKSILEFHVGLDGQENGAATFGGALDPLSITFCEKELLLFGCPYCAVHDSVFAFCWHFFGYSYFVL